MKMLKIDNLSNDIDTTAVHGGQTNGLGVGIGGITVNTSGSGSLIGPITTIVDVPTVVANQFNFNTTAITNVINETAIGVLGTAIA
jgi:hypothetical protein